MQITKKITVTIEGEELISLLLKALRPKAQSSEDKEQVLFRALSNLIGCPATEAVRLSNKYADNHALPRITADEFRKWLPEMLSETFREFVERKNNDQRKGGRQSK